MSWRRFSVLEGERPDCRLLFDCRGGGLSILTLLVEYLATIQPDLLRSVSGLSARRVWFRGLL